MTTLNPLGIHCAACTIDAPCGLHAEQVRAEAEYQAERHTHQTHLAHLPWVGHWHVYCDQGCNLGTSAVQPTFETAVKRADLHDKATRTLGKRS